MTLSIFPIFLISACLYWLILLFYSLLLITNIQKTCTTFPYFLLANQFASINPKKNSCILFPILQHQDFCIKLHLKSKCLHRSFYLFYSFTHLYLYPTFKRLSLRSHKPIEEITSSVFPKLSHIGVSPVNYILKVSTSTIFLKFCSTIHSYS